MKTAIISSDTSINHLTGDGHPEQPKRVVAITEKLKKQKNLIWDKPSTFDHKILKKAHDENYINMVQKSFPNEGIKFLDGDTIISPGSKDATIDAVGSVIKAIDGVESKKFKNAFCVVRLALPSKGGASQYLDIMQKKIKRWVFVFITNVQLQLII